MKTKQLRNKKEDKKKTTLIAVTNGETNFTSEIREQIKKEPELLLDIIKFPLSKKDKVFIKKNSNIVTDIDKERLRFHLNDLLLSNQPSNHLLKMDRLGLLQALIPEFEECKGLKQNGDYHKFDVFHHCLYTADNTDKDIVLRFAALFHDIGKARTNSFKKGHVTFYKHEVASASMAYDILSRLEYDESFIKEVISLVRLHMYHYTKDWTDKAVRRFIKKAGINKHNIQDLGNLPLFKLRSADRMGSGIKNVAITVAQKKFEDRIEKVFYKDQESRKQQNFIRKEKQLNGVDRNLLYQIFTKNNELSETESKIIIEYLYKKVKQGEVNNNKLELLGEAIRYLILKNRNN